MVNINSELTALGMYSAIALSSGTVSAFGSFQTILTPDETWVSVGVLVASVTVSVAATLRVFKFITHVEKNFEKVDRHIKRLAKHSGLSEAELDE